MKIELRSWYYEYEGTRKSFTSIYGAVFSLKQESWYELGAPTPIKCYQTSFEVSYV